VSAEDDAEAVLAGFVPLGPDAPQAQALGQSVAADIIARAVAEREHEIEGQLLEGCVAGDATGVARPGDVLIVSAPEQITPEQARELKAGLINRLPGIADVIVMPGLRVEGIYRGGSPP
jgi:hypothetical protein